jgi:hypothetical protein
MQRQLVASTASAAVALVVAGAALAGAPKPPKTVTASAIKRQPGTLKPGTAVSSSSVGTRTFVNADDGFALASTTDAQYPAATTDGGKTWSTDGPALHVNAAQAPLSVHWVGAANVRTVFAYGGGQAVDVTSDGGKHWWRALLGDSVDAVVPGAGKRLDAFVQAATGTGSSKVVDWTYVSTDGGRHWHYTTGFVGG